MSTISTHVLDTSVGRPAAGIRVSLERIQDPLGVRPLDIGHGVTDADGRVRDLLRRGASLEGGIYRLRFDVGTYFTATGREAFYPEVVIVFRVGAEEEHYHVPLLVSPFGYSTYRGS